MTPADSQRPETAGKPPRPGPVYDSALRQWAIEDLVSVGEWIGLEPDPNLVRVSEALPTSVMYPDLLLGFGNDRLAQVEFVRRPNAELIARLLEYRARIMRLHPGNVLSQHVLVLADGKLPTVVRNGDFFTMHLDVIYLREQDPAALLAKASLAPLAVLAKARTPQRPELLRAALEVIRSSDDTTRREGLAGIALTLAAIRLHPDTIEEVRKEATMPIDLEGTIAGEMIAQRSRAAGVAAGAVAERRTNLLTVLEHRFGPDQRIPAVADTLLTRDAERALATAIDAASLDDLL